MSRAKIKQYTEKEINDALEAIKGGMSRRTASITFGIPHSTLNDHASGECNIFKDSCI